MAGDCGLGCAALSFVGPISSSPLMARELRAFAASRPIRRARAAHAHEIWALRGCLGGALRAVLGRGLGVAGGREEIALGCHEILFSPIKRLQRARAAGDDGMTGWKDIPSDDGVPLEAWNIPAEGDKRNKPVVFNDSWPMCHAGFPSHSACRGHA